MANRPRIFALLSCTTCVIFLYWVKRHFSQAAPGPWLVERIPWSAAEHRISAKSAGKAIAEALDIDASSAVLVVERQTWSAEQPVTHVRFTYPGASQTLVARFTPSQR